MVTTVGAPSGTATPAGTPDGDLAVCTLTDHALAEQLANHPRVAVIGPLATANLGIERLVAAAVALPRVHRLVLCGADSRVFGQGQSLLAFARNGVTEDGRIIGAQGHQPRLTTLRPAVARAFRRRITVVDHIGLSDVHAISRTLDRQPLPRPEPVRDGESLLADLAATGPPTVRLPAGGSRRPIGTHGSGFFVIDVDRAEGRLVLRHYTPDRTHCSELRSRTTEALLLGAVRHRLIGETELTHAGYLGAELAKAEAALRLGLTYVQDRPLARPRLGEAPGHATPDGDGPRAREGER